MDKGTIIIIIVCAIITVAAIGAAVYQYYNSKKMLNRINQMLSHAIDGNFTEMDFDESLLSEIENNMAKYLSASELSARNVEEEKKRLHHLISDISHQTKTPLSNIKLYTELLKEADLDGETADNAERLYRQADKLEFLIETLVKMSRLESGILTLHPEKGSLGEIIKNICAQYKDAAEKKNLEFEVVPTDCEAFFDEKWTLEAVGNVVDNAIKYTDKGSIKISAKSYEMFACIEVADTGRGIRESELGSIFGRFVRSADVKNEDGVGIGLYLAREIMQQQGGYIKVKSEYGRGSAFLLYFRRN